MPNINYLRNTKTPLILHFIWVGGHLPQKYLRTLIKIAPVARKSHFTLNLWLDDIKNFNVSLDNFMGFNDQNKLFLDLAINAKTLGITLRNINELLPAMEKSNFYQNANRLRHFKNFVRREAVGFKNLAAVSDLLRYEILRQEGGIYSDTDTDFNIEKNSLFEPIKLPWGIKTTYFTETQNGNDIIATVPQHPALKYTLEHSLEAYQKIDQRVSNKKSLLDNYFVCINISPFALDAQPINYFLIQLLATFRNKIESSLMDLKRSYLDSHIGMTGTCPRMDLTLFTSGPAAFKVGLNQFNNDCKPYEWCEIIESMKTFSSHSKTPSYQERVNNIDNKLKKFQLDPFFESESKETSRYTLGNVSLASESDQTWMPSENQKKVSFDDHHIASQSLFWKSPQQVKTDAPLTSQLETSSSLSRTHGC